MKKNARPENAIATKFLVIKSQANGDFILSYWPVKKKLKKIQNYEYMIYETLLQQFCAIT